MLSRLPPFRRHNATMFSRARLLSLVLLAVLVLSIAAMAIYARKLNSQLAETSEARFDNLTWFVAQAEVEFLTLQNTVLALPVEATMADLDRATQAFDIFYSRIRFFDRDVLQVQTAGNAAMLQDLERLRAQSNDLAEVFDASPANPAALRATALPLLDAMRPELRKFSLDSLHLFVERTAAQRLLNTRTLARFSTMAVILVALLSAIVVIVADMYRDLRIRARTIDRVTTSLRSTISAAPEAIIVTDAVGRITDFNRAAENIFDRTASQAIGQDLADLILTGGVAALPAVGTRGVMTARHPGDGDLPVEVTALRDQDSEGRPIHVIFLRDLRQQMAVETTLRRARDAAEQNAEARARFLAVMSHEMRTPLQSVLAALDLLGRGTLSPQQRKHLTIALDSGHTALNQVDDLLDLARQEDGSGAELPTTFDPLAVARRIADTVGVLAAERGDRIVLDLPPPATVGLVSGPGRSFERALGNLVSNAVKFTRDGQITVSIASAPVQDSPETVLTITVTDEGIGIAPEDQARIFDDFETLDTSLTRREGGTGLGLGIVRRAVAALGGTITVESVPGKGSRFRFTARLQRIASAPAAPVSRSAIAHTPGLSVLLAEDTSVNRVLLREMMTRMGHDVVVAANGAEACALADTRSFDALVMDISMPVMDGITATAKIRQGKGPSHDAPVMGLTAHALPDDIARIKAGGIAHVVTKPVRYDALEAALSAITQPPHDPLLDRASVADTLTILPPEAHLALISRFEDETRRYLCEIPTAAPDRQAELRHALQGSSGMMGARRLHRMLLDNHCDATSMRACLDATTEALRAEIGSAAAQMPQQYAS